MSDMFIFFDPTHFTQHENENDPFVLKDNIADVMSTLQERAQGCTQNPVEHLRYCFFRCLTGF